MAMSPKNVGYVKRKNCTRKRTTDRVPDETKLKFCRHLFVITKYDFRILHGRHAMVQGRQEKLREDRTKLEKMSNRDQGWSIYGLQRRAEQRMKGMKWRKKTGSRERMVRFCITENVDEVIKGIWCDIYLP